MTTSTWKVLLLLLFLHSGTYRNGTDSVLFVTARKSWADVAATSKPASPTTVIDTAGNPPLSSSSTKDTIEKTRANIKRQSELLKQQTQNKKQKVASSSSYKHEPVYSKLPMAHKDCQLYKVRNVYDGDTLTLVDGRRVRFLGIDTPEIDVKQPYAQEAKDYVKSFCHKRSIYLDILKGKPDKYGRLLANVWVELPNSTAQSKKFLNVNEGIIASGFGTVYIANSKDPKPKNYKTLLLLQKQARTKRLGMWDVYNFDRKVVVTKYGTAYHLPTCKHLQNSYSKYCDIISVGQALDKGLHPCRTCLADE